MHRPLLFFAFILLTVPGRADTSTAVANAKPGDLVASSAPNQASPLLHLPFLHYYHVAMVTDRIDPRGVPLVAEKSDLTTVRLLPLDEFLRSHPQSDILRPKQAAGVNARAAETIAEWAASNEWTRSLDCSSIVAAAYFVSGGTMNGLTPDWVASGSLLVGTSRDDPDTASGTAGGPDDAVDKGNDNHVDPEGGDNPTE